MRRIDLPTELPAVRAATSAVFKNLDPYDVRFTPAIKHRFVLFPVDHYQLTFEQFRALAQAAAIESDDFAYQFDVEQWPKFGWDERRREYWRIQLDDYVSYERPPDDANIVIMQNAVVSPRGAWGLVISDENHAIVGGSDEFAGVLLRDLGVSEQEMMDRWIAVWRRNRDELGYDASWLRDQLAHLSVPSPN
jgi:hypothetical protein